MAKLNRQYLKMLRPFDYIIVGLLIVLSFLPLFIFSWQQSTAKDETKVLTAVVTHDGQTLYSQQLTGHSGTTTYRYQAKDGDYNLIVVKDDTISIKEANCTDQVCVRQGQIKQAGETIVCLPHKIIVEIKSSDGKQDGGMVTE